MNPYRNREDYCFWSRSMTRPMPGDIDPCVEGRIIKPQDRVATIGSCFAQHLGRFISQSGLNYFIPENGPADMDEAERVRQNYGVFSGRYGNVYTVRQLNQLFDRAFGTFLPEDDIWERESRFVDAFRPQIHPDGFETRLDVEQDRRLHLAHVRTIFTETDFLIFTLGLTEAWRSKKDGAVYPIAPGVNGGSFDPTRHEFVNFTVHDVERDLFDFIERVTGVNAAVQIILTISPVPLIATYEPRHVLVSTAFSKAALRVAADAAERRYENVVYFPSFEIITSPASGGRYYEDDLRQVKDLGVKHVMRVFSRHFFESPSSEEAAPVNGEETGHRMIINNPGVVCDEEVIEIALNHGRSLNV